MTQPDERDMTRARACARLVLLDVLCGDVPDFDEPAGEYLLNVAKAPIAALLTEREAAVRQEQHEALAKIKAKCEQYWNEPNICDAEIHAVLEQIHRWARLEQLAAAPPPTKENE